MECPYLCPGVFCLLAISTVFHVGLNKSNVILSPEIEDIEVVLEEPLRARSGPAIHRHLQLADRGRSMCRPFGGHLAFELQLLPAVSLEVVQVGFVGDDEFTCGESGRTVV